MYINRETHSMRVAEKNGANVFKQTHGVLEAGDGGLGVLAEGDGVVEDLVSSRGLDGEGVARARVLKHWHGSSHLGGQLGGHT